jgi:hypothetical protein
MTELAIRTPSLGVRGEAAGVVRGPLVRMAELTLRTPSNRVWSSGNAIHLGVCAAAVLLGAADHILLPQAFDLDGVVGHCRAITLRVLSPRGAGLPQVGRGAECPSHWAKVPDAGSLGVLGATADLVRSLADQRQVSGLEVI